MAALACKNTAMASDGDEIREAAAVGRTLLERYGDEAQLVKKVGTGIHTEFIKKNNKKGDVIYLVEANPNNIPFLKKCWEKYPNVNIYNYAITTNNISNN